MTITLIAGGLSLAAIVLSDSKYLHHFIAQMIDYLYRDTAERWLVKRAGGVAVERAPGVFIDLGFERGLERLVRVVRAKEIRVTDEEALLVLVGIDEPAGDPVGAVAADFARVGVEHVHAVDLDLNLPFP